MNGNDSSPASASSQLKREEDNRLSQLQQTTRLLLGGLVILGATVIALLIVVIWIATSFSDRINDNEDDIERFCKEPDSPVLDADFIISDGADENDLGFVGSIFQGSGSWTNQAQLSEARSDFSAVAYEDIIYICGGLDSNNNVLDTCISYDTITRQYNESLAPMPSPRHRYAVALSGSKIYFIGGWETVDASSPEKTTFVYDIGSNTWSQGPDTQTAFGDTCAAEYNGMIIIAGGWGENYITLSAAELLDTTADNLEWATLPDLPTERGDVMCARLSDKAYFAGGYFDASPESIEDAFLATVEAYDFNTGLWEPIPDMLVGRGDGVLVPVESGSGDYLLVVGGETHGRGQIPQIPRHDVEIFYPSTNVWVPKAPIPTARFRFGAASDAEGIVYAIGGHDACTTNFETGETDCPENAHSTVEAFFLTNEPQAFLYGIPHTE